MTKVYAKNSQYTGESAGVPFAGGVGETNDFQRLVWFDQKGYTVEWDYGKLSVSELHELADARGIKVEKNAKKDDLIEALTEKGESNAHETEVIA